MSPADPQRCPHASPVSTPHGCRRREFLQAAAALPAAMMAAQLAQGQSPATAKLPQITFGKHSISRLVCGSNPFHGGSHLSTFVNREMHSYYTDEQILKTLHHCEEVGINAWQSDPHRLETYRRHVDAGGKMTSWSSPPAIPNLAKLAAGGCIAVAHHGEVTDNLFNRGKLDHVNEYLQRIRDAGMMVGVSTHMPDVVDAIESKGWDLDYYMTCIYERHRSEETLKEELLPLRRRSARSI